MIYYNSQINNKLKNCYIKQIDKFIIKMKNM